MLSINFKKLSLVQIAAIIIIIICLIDVMGLSLALSTGFQYSPTYTKGSESSNRVADMFALITIALFACGIVAGAGLYFYKSWSRPIVIGIAILFLFQSLPGLLRIVHPEEPFGIKDIFLALFALFAAWVLYYFNRSNVKEKFIKDLLQNQSTRSLRSG